MIKEWLVITFLILGSCFMLVASIGIIRLPDIYMRMHATTKAPTLGMLLMLISICLFFGNLLTVVKSILIIFFIFLTIPVAAHMIGRAAHLIQTPKWEKTNRDDLEKDQRQPKEASHQ